MLDKIPAHLDNVLGFLLMRGLLFCWKAYQAMVKGKMKYWHGFLPFTFVSPFVMHLPAGKVRLPKKPKDCGLHADGSSFHAVRYPLFGCWC